MNTIFTAERLFIRPFALSDEKLLYEAARESIEEIYPWLEWCHPDYTIEESRSWIASCIQHWQEKTEFTFAIFEREHQRLLGCCSVNSINRLHRFGNLGYWLRSSATGNGYATEAVLLLRSFIYSETDLQRLEIIVSTENTASTNVAKRSGAFFEGVLRQRLLLHGKFHDASVFSFVGSDLEAGE